MVKENINTGYAIQTKEQNEGENTSGEVFWGIFIWLMTTIITIPLFCYCSNILPNPDWILNLDRCLLFVIGYFIAYIIVCWLRYLFFVAACFCIVLLSYGSINNSYGWGNACSDYIAISFDQKLRLRDKEIRFACDYQASSVRSFALNHTSSLSLNIDTKVIPFSGEKGMVKEIHKYYDTLNKYDRAIKKIQKEINEKQQFYSLFNFYNSYKENERYLTNLKAYRDNCASQLKYMEIVNDFYKKIPYKTIIQVFSIFKYVNEQWDYVCDPDGEEYFAKASESIHTLKGDCDDYAILLASCIQAIGGTSRIVLTHNHAFPEFKIEKENFDDACFLIKTFFDKEIKGQQIHFQVDAKNENIIWLNMDCGKYPGEKFYEEDFKISSVIYFK